MRAQQSQRVLGVLERARERHRRRLMSAIGKAQGRDTDFGERPRGLDDVRLVGMTAESVQDERRAATLPAREVQHADALDATDLE